MSTNENVQKLLGDKKALAKIMNSQDARALANLLTRNRDAASLRQAAEQAANGDTASLNALLRSVTNSPEGAKLLKRLNETVTGK